MRILIVGRNPSKKNLKAEQPFIGTRSYVRLLRWIEQAKIKDYDLVNVSNRIDMKKPTLEEIAILGEMFFHYDVILALGNDALNAIYAANDMIETPKPVVFLPHPSGRNRALNSPDYERQMISILRLQLKDRIK